MSSRDSAPSPPDQPGATTFATPTPRTLYVHDDLSGVVETSESAAARRLGEALLARLRAEPSRIVVLTLREQVDALVARGSHAPFDVAVGIGEAGAHVAAAVHARTGWFPRVDRVDLWREETSDGAYALGGADALGARLHALPDARALAIVDDTIFSGFTVRAVIAALPPRLRAVARVFALRATVDTLRDLATPVPVIAGIVLDGRLLSDVSVITACGLVRRGSIRRAGRAPLAFFERPEWMAAWFPDDHAEVTALCRELCAALEAEALLPR